MKNPIIYKKIKVLVGLTIFLWSPLISAQRFEIGPSIGVTTVLNDQINSLEKSSSLGGGLIFKYNTSKRWSYRFSYSYLPTNLYQQSTFTDIDTGITDLNNDSRIDIQEFTAGVEFNFFEYQVPHKNKNSTPYLIAQLAAVNYNKKLVLGIPVGIGYKTKVFSNIAFAVESRAQYLFDDELDNWIDKKEPQNLNSRNDWYIYTGFSLQYTFGRDKCYTTPRW
ncbi:MAG: DUF6089 family protein [Flavobacteriaceae bacterium]